MDTPELKVDTERWEWTGNHDTDPTRIYVRAKTPDGYASVDIWCLDKYSLVAFLRSKRPQWTEVLVFQLLGHTTNLPQT